MRKFLSYVVILIIFAGAIVTLGVALGMMQP